MRYKTMFSFVALFLLCSPAAFAVEFKGDDARKDHNKFQGTWVLVSGEVDGEKIKPDHAAKSKMIIEDAKVTIVAPHLHGEPFVAETFTIDTTAKPKKWGCQRKTGPHSAVKKPIAALFEFEGDDLLTVVLDPTAGSTPKEMASKKGTGHIKHTWKRVKP